jgi:hypothetical protein
LIEDNGDLYAQLFRFEKLNSGKFLNNLQLNIVKIGSELWAFCPRQDTDRFSSTTNNIDAPINVIKIWNALKLEFNNTQLSQFVYLMDITSNNVYTLID